MTQLVISVDDRCAIEQNDDQEKTMLDIVIKRGEPNKSVCIDVLMRNSGYADLAQKLKSDSSSSVPSTTKTGKICMCHHTLKHIDPWFAFDTFIEIRNSCNKPSNCTIIPYTTTCKAYHDSKVNPSV